MRVRTKEGEWEWGVFSPNAPTPSTTSKAKQTAFLWEWDSSFSSHLPGGMPTLPPHLGFHSEGKAEKHKAPTK